MHEVKANLIPSRLEGPSEEIRRACAIYGLLTKDDADLKPSDKVKLSQTLSGMSVKLTQK